MYSCLQKYDKILYSRISSDNYWHRLRTWRRYFGPNLTAKWYTDPVTATVRRLNITNRKVRHWPQSLRQLSLTTLSRSTRLDVFTSALLNITVLWGITRRNWLTFTNFQTNLTAPHLQGSAVHEGSWAALSWRLRELRCFETSAAVYYSTRRNNPNT